MNIITAPHQGLRTPAQPITKVDKKTTKFLSELELTLKNKKNPTGVGLAAPQLNEHYRAFVTFLPNDIDDNPETTHSSRIKTYINPEITKHSKETTFGPDNKDPNLEGCLSIPKLYGPIPRWKWIELEFDSIIEGELKRDKVRLEWFSARVAQHEFDHLQGILFTDYSLEYDLPLYKEDAQGKLIEIDNRIAQLF